MKHFLAALTTGLVVSLPLPSLADTVLPHLYAKVFCDLRSIGIDGDGARRTAMQQSTIGVDEWTMVKGKDGSLFRSDIVLAVMTAYDRCPEFLK